MSIGKFDILVPYTDANGSLDRPGDEEARERGMVAAIGAAVERGGPA